MFRELYLVFWKNLIIRKRHWGLTIVESLVPIFLFGLIAYGRSKINGLNKQDFNETTYVDPYTASLLHNYLPVGDFYLWYAPYTSNTEDIIKRVQIKFQVPGQDIKEFNSEELLLQHYAAHNNRTVIAVIFRGDNRKLDYDIRMQEKYFSWDTNKLYHSTNEHGSDTSKYIHNGFLALQLAIDTSFMEKALGLEPTQQLNNVSLSVQEFPYPPHRSDSGLNSIFMDFLPLVTIFSFIFLCPAVLKRVVEEKTSGIKEFMKMMGMKSWMMWVGWYIHAFVANLFSIVAIVFLMKVALWGVAYPPIEYCDGTVLFVFLFLYCLASITFCFFISSLFNRPSIAMVVGILVWIFSYFIPRAYVTEVEGVAWGIKVLLGIFPNMALHYGFAAMSPYEVREVGVQWSNLFTSGSEGDDDVTMGAAFVIFIVDTALLMLLTVYIDNVRPGEYGIAKPLHFPTEHVKQLFKSLFNKTSPMSDEAVRLQAVEKGHYCIEINQLRKSFGSVSAVDGLDLQIPAQQITVLLGENGAGKTTTMSIITGMIPATSGSVTINGINIKSGMHDVRKQLGLCPQHNLLFTDLTVHEHLRFFALLKGASCVEACQQANEILATLNLTSKKQELAPSLSGGMKRKLCLGMALIGTSSVLILDEPTAGMDPESRRQVWDLLLKYRKTKTILITTHFMDEADALADYIAIMANGHKKCFGTPLELKKQYKTGYHFSVGLKSRPDDEIDGNDKSVGKITKIVKDVFEDAELLPGDNGNVVYVLPLDGDFKHSSLFDKLNADGETSQLINNMGLSLTTLQDVFMKANSDTDKGNLQEEDLPDTISLESKSSSRRHVKPLMWKRLLFLKKNWLIYLSGVAAMLLIMVKTAYLMNMDNLTSFGESSPKLILNLSSYGKTGVFYGGPASANRFKDAYKNFVLGQNSHAFDAPNVSQAIVEKGIENIAYYKKHMVGAAEFDNTNGEILVTAWYSGQAVHAPAVSLNLVTNALIRTLLDESYSITTSNSPLPSVASHASFTEQSEVQIGLLWLILVPIGLLFFFGNFILFPNSEISTQFKQLQFTYGVQPLVYWLCNLFFDYCCIVIVLSLTICLLFTVPMFNVEEYRVVLSIFMMYSFAALPFTYLFGYCKTTAGGFALLLMIGIFVGIVPTIVIAVLDSSGDASYQHYGNILRVFFLIFFPQFGLSYTSVKFSRKFVQNRNWEVMAEDKRKYLCITEKNPCCEGDSPECLVYKNYFSNPELGVSADLLTMILAFFVVFLVLLLIDYYKKCEVWMKGSYTITNENKTPISVKDLKKSFGWFCFPKFEAVKGVSFDPDMGECYGLLGTNGAGKTTTFQMLTQNVIPDKGTIGRKRNKMVGYCPQSDTLNYSIKGRDLLSTVALIRGRSDADAEKEVNTYLKIFGLEKYGDKVCMSYSGGNKRKLNMCLAFIGSPSIILLDEPTNGVDPSGRFLAWDTLSKSKKNNKTTFVLCSHSMEECENLCDTIGIMKGGEIKAQGSLPQLKEDYQKGYTVMFKLRVNDVELESISVPNEPVKSLDVVDGIEIEPEGDVNVLEKDMKTEFKEFELKDKHMGVLYYHVKEELTLQEIFSKVEKLRKKHPFIMDYTINDTSLEDIFLTIAKATN